MAKYTIELGELLSRGYPLNLNNYPIFNENYREILNNKIINHYYFREIGQETADRFNFCLARKMDEIMPYYNQLYMSEMIKFDPISTEYVEENTLNTNFIKSNSEKDTSHAQKESIGDVTSSITQTSNTQDYTGNIQGSGTNEETENITSKSTQTNDLTTTVDSTSDGNGTQDTSGSKTSIFSDTPQTPITQSTTVNADGSITYNSESYATTITTDRTNQNDKTTTHEEGNSTSKNTGTVVTEGESERTLNGKTSSTNDETRKIETSNTDKEDIEKNITRNDLYSNLVKDAQKTKEKRRQNIFTNGRRGFSPSKLLEEYRNTFLNIDERIINDLESLFMGVF